LESGQEPRQCDIINKLDILQTQQTGLRVMIQKINEVLERRTSSASIGAAEEVTSSYSSEYTMVMSSAELFCCGAEDSTCCVVCYML